MGRLIFFAKIRQKNRITIPKDIMELLELKEGDDLIFIYDKNIIRIGKIKREIVDKIEKKD